MTRPDSSDKKWGTAFRPGRHSAHEFDKLVSPLGENCSETPVYSPSKAVTGAKGQKQGRASQTEYAKNERRGG